MILNYFCLKGVPEQIGIASNKTRGLVGYKKKKTVKIKSHILPFPWCISYCLVLNVPCLKNKLAHFKIRFPSAFVFKGCRSTVNHLILKNLFFYHLHLGSQTKLKAAVSAGDVSTSCPPSSLRHHTCTTLFFSRQLSLSLSLLKHFWSLVPLILARGIINRHRERWNWYCQCRYQNRWILLSACAEAK